MELCDVQGQILHPRYEFFREMVDLFRTGYLVQILEPQLMKIISADIWTVVVPVIAERVNSPELDAGR